MNKTVAILIGAGVGGSLGWFVGAVIAEMIALKEFPWEDYEYNDLDEDPGNDDESNAGEITNMNDQRRPKRVRNYSEYFEQIQRPDLVALTKKYNAGEAPIEGIQADSIIEDEWNEIEEDVDSGDIQIISTEEFMNADLPKVKLMFFDDDVVTDEHSVPIKNPEELIGEEALVSFGSLSEDENKIYVLNRLKNAVYEVVRANKAYMAPPRRRDRIKKEVSENAEEVKP